MAKVRFTPKAEEDLRAIWRVIAKDNETAADTLLLNISEKAELAATQPQMGSPRPELSVTARILIEGNYLIIYEPNEDGIVVVAIVHGSRDMENWLS